jgi:2-polyprenyl-6-methoxyphenol hydroxylase-like FAD-dependent oxidoreductase
MSTQHHYHQQTIIIVGLGPVGSMLALLTNKFNPHTKIIILEETDGSLLHKLPHALALDDEVVRTAIQNIGLLTKFRQTTSVAAHMQIVTDWISNTDNTTTTTPKVLSGVTNISPGNKGNWTKFDDGKITKIGRHGFQSGATAFWAPQLEKDLRQFIIDKKDQIEIRTCTRVINIAENSSEVLVEVESTSGYWERDINSLQWKFIFNSSSNKDRNNTKQIISCSYAIGCDGARSTVRKLIFPGMFRSLDYDERYLVVDIIIDEQLIGTLIPDFTTYVAGKREYIFVGGSKNTPPDIPKGKKHLRIDIKLNPNIGEDRLPAKYFLEPIGLIQNVNYSLVRYAIYNIHGLIAEQWSTGRIFLAGDAAHVMPPLLGQGLNSGFRDVVSLSWRLGIATDNLFVGEEKIKRKILQTYQDRIPQANFIVSKSVEIGQLCAKIGHSHEDLSNVSIIDPNFISNAFLKVTNHSDRLSSYRKHDKFAGLLFPQWCLVKDKQTSDVWNELSDYVLFEVAGKCAIAFLIWIQSENNSTNSNNNTNTNPFFNHSSVVMKTFTEQCYGSLHPLSIREHFGSDISRIPKCLQNNHAVIVFPDRIILGSALIYSPELNELVMNDLRKEIGYNYNNNKL